MSVLVSFPGFTGRSQSNQGYSYRQCLWLVPLATIYPYCLTHWLEWVEQWLTGERCEAGGKWSVCISQANLGTDTFEWLKEEIMKIVFSLWEKSVPKINKKRKYMYIITHRHIYFLYNYICDRPLLWSVVCVMGITCNLVGNAKPQVSRQYFNDCQVIDHAQKCLRITANGNVCDVWCFID